MVPELRPTQKEAIARICTETEIALFHPMGAGKTRTVLEALQRLQLLGEGKAAVVAPHTVAHVQQVWEHEAEKFGIRADFGVTSFDRLHRPESRALLEEAEILVVDELSFVKSFSRRFRELRRHSFKRRIGLTGTPLGNSYLNLFYQIQTLDGGKRLGRNKETWRNKYFYPIDYNRFRWEPRDEAEVLAQIQDMCHVVESVDLPALLTNEIEVPMPRDQAKHYEAIKRHLVTQLSDPETTVVAANQAVKSGKLRQVGSGFLYTEPLPGERGTLWLSPYRLRALEETLAALDSPAICLYQFDAERELILAHTDARVLSPESIEAWNKGEVPLLLMHPASGGHGLNLQHGGHHLIWWSLPWSLDLWQQTIARVRRPGQPNDTVFNHVMVSPGALDQEMLRRLDNHQSVESAALEWLRSASGA